MMRYLKLFVLLAGLLLTQVVFAQQRPTFDTLSAAGLTENLAHLRGGYNSRDNNYPSAKQPQVWFRYGTNTRRLSKKTPEAPKEKGNYIVSHIVRELNPTTKYYYQSVMRFEGSLFYGEIRSFVTKESGFTASEKNNSQDFLVSPQRPKTILDYIGFGRKEEKRDPDANLVHSPEEIKAAQEAREKKEQELLKTQENYSDSAANNDGWGDVIEYNTNYKHNYKAPTTNQYKKNKSQAQRTRSSEGSLNYPVLLLILLLLFLVVFLLYTSLRKKRQRMTGQQGNSFAAQRSRPQAARPHGLKMTPQRKPPQDNKPLAGRYHIPVRKDLYKAPQGPYDQVMQQDPKNIFKDKK